MRRRKTDTTCPNCNADLTDTTNVIIEHRGGHDIHRCRACREAQQRDWARQKAARRKGRMFKFNLTSVEVIECGANQKKDGGDTLDIITHAEARGVVEIGGGTADYRIKLTPQENELLMQIWDSVAERVDKQIATQIKPKERIN